MFNINTNNINVINNGFSSDSQLDINWLQHTNVNDDLELSNQYANICQQHTLEKKWVLFINPEESSIEKLAKAHDIDVSKILMVNYKNNAKRCSNVALEQIKSVLCKGNCAAVILSNSTFEANDIAQLESSAKTGKTHCFVLKRSQLH